MRHNFLITIHAITLILIFIMYRILYFGHQTMLNYSLLLTSILFIFTNVTSTILFFTVQIDDKIDNRNHFRKLYLISLLLSFLFIIVLVYIRVRSL